MKKMEISKKVVQRLTEYLSILKEVRKNEKNINSIKLSKIMNTTSAQVRKDLSTFGEFGVRNENTNVIIVGHGKMGEMLTKNIKVLGKGFNIIGIFDKDPEKIGQIASDQLKIEIKDIENINNFIKEYPGKIETAILSVVKENAQIAAEQLVETGITAILNMTTYKLELPKEITVVNVDISAKLQELNFWRINSNNINWEEE